MGDFFPSRAYLYTFLPVIICQMLTFFYQPKICRQIFLDLKYLFILFSVGGGTPLSEIRLEEKRVALRRALKREYMKQGYDPAGSTATGKVIIEKSRKGRFLWNRN